MIKASALLAAGAIGLLVAGVLASSLLMVYVSIAVCAVAALILAAGILTHWAEIFGRAEHQPAGVPESWSAPQAQVSTPVLASAQATATSGRAERRSRREDAGGRPPAAPPEVARPPAGLPVPGRGDDLWDRVEEELGSAGKRDTGALSWPGIELPALSEAPATAGPAEKAGPQGPPSAGTKAWVWGQGPGWQPPETPDPSWPPPAAAFAGASAPAGAGPAAEEPPGPVPEAEAAGSVTDAEGASPGSPGDDSGAAAPGDEATRPAAEDEQAGAGPARPQWIISLPGREPPAADHPRPADEARTGDPAATDADAAAVKPEAVKPEAVEAAAAEPEAGPPAAEEPEAEEPEAEEPQAEEPQAAEPAAAEPEAAEPEAAEAATPEPSADEPAAGGPASESGPGRIEVTVVPGVARYHRSECILIRFLGAGDLEIMTRQEAEEAKLVPCRACQPDQLEG